MKTPRRLGTVVVTAATAMSLASASPASADPTGSPSPTAVSSTAAQPRGNSAEASPKLPGPQKKRSTKKVVREVRGAPVNSTPRRVTQPDGSTVTITTRGDNLRTWTTESGGATVAKDAKGYWRYATGLDKAGQPIAGAQKAGSAAPPRGSKGLKPSKDISTAPTLERAPGSFTGAQRTIVILAQFSDQAAVGSTAADWSSKFFGASGSVRAFYKGASFNKIDVAPAAESSGAANDGVVGWVTLPMAHPNTAGDTGAANQQLTAAAIRAADPYVNYASFDSNGNGTIEPAELHITVIAAGYETSYGGSPCGKSVWAHQWAIGGGVAAPTVDGKVVGSQGYTQFGEMHCSSDDPTDSHPATIGVMAHEFGHDLDLPDLYDISYRTEGVGQWSLMSSGSWGTTGSGPAGNAPTMLDAYSKYLLGWISPTRVTSATNVSIPQASSSNVAYQLLGDPDGAGVGSQGEFFLVENRQPVGLDAALPGCGILVYHVKEVFRNNMWGATGRLIDVEEASEFENLNFTGNTGGPDDPWHGHPDHTQFNSTTKPNSLSYNGQDAGVSMTATGGCAPTMQATLAGTGTITVAKLANDNFANAISLAQAGGQLSQSTMEGTRESGEPFHAAMPSGASVWFTWTAPSNGLLSVDTGGSSFDTLLGIYTGSSVGALTEVASNDDWSESMVTSSIEKMRVKAGTTYRIAADGFDGEMGDLRLRWSFVTSPANDDFAAARALTPADGGSLVQSTANATKETGEPDHVWWGRPSVWFSWTAPSAGRVTFDTAGSDYNTMMAAYTGSSVSTLTNVASNQDADSATGMTAARISSLDVMAGTTYRIAVVGELEATGNLKFAWSFAANVAPKFVSLVPSRILDTRSGNGAPAAMVPAYGQVDLQVTGCGGVPAGASAVVLNVTAVQPAGWGYLTGWPTGAAKPTASNVNYVAGLNIPNLVVAKIGAGGRVSIASSARSHILADVAGYYPAGSAFTGMTPVRVLDTRTGTGAPKVRVPAGGSVTLAVGGTAGVPLSASAAMLNVTTVAPSAAGTVTAFPAGVTAPTATSVSFRSGQTIAGFGVVKLGVGGKVTLRSTATTDLLVDVSGWVPAGADTVASTPARLVTTRAVTGGSAFTVKVAGVGAVPTTAKAVQVTLTAANPSQSGYLTAYPSGASRPVVSNVNYSPGGSVSNAAVVKVGTGGTITVYSSNNTPVTVDISAHWTP
ncbi:M6 family metalloprotease domain-containing protein [Yimella sp. cx-573]|nr:M6 family metalloprotease domain-containing protein [Yimella sp. cx-573]